MSEPCQAMVFRDVREQLSTRECVALLRASLDACDGSPQALLPALLCAGALESALADAAHPQAAIASRTSEGVAQAFLDIVSTNQLRHLAEACSRLDFNFALNVSRPEGFAFYALHPLDYAAAIRESPLPGKQAIVIGIRTIGSTLSAIVVAALREKLVGVSDKASDTHPVQRFTVRPTGHPYDRACEFSPEQREQIISADPDATFFIVDEGPGLSGSSFLSVGEALVAAGVHASRIRFVCSRAVDAAYLVAPDAAARWSKFQTIVAKPRHAQPAGSRVAPAQDWRERAFQSSSEWPGRWSQMAAPCFVCGSGKQIFKFEGLGRYGDERRCRNNALAAAGFTTRSSDAGDGFSKYSIVAGRALAPSDARPAVLQRIAEYLAFRVRAFSVAQDAVRISDLEQMGRFNAAQATSRELPATFTLPTAFAVIADACMMPHKFLQPDDGGPLLKLDCAAHGDDHFFPGPVDVAWDIAGTIVEWSLAPSHAAEFVQAYERMTGDHVSARLDNHILAYAAFRNGYCRMAASAMTHDAREQARLLRDALRYRSILEEAFRESAAVA